MFVQIKNFKKLEKDALRGSFDLFFQKGGFTIRDCTFFHKNGRSWISMPSRRYEKDGQVKYHYFVHFEKEKMDQLQEYLIPKLKELGNEPVQSSFDEMPF